ncbi:MAG TPA: fused response regulator/phosphatase [Chondromyces sp.]|nr:fused response regulator/phosphatase [Chondromyces sp.]
MGILIVDDNQVNLFVVENLLKRAGYKDYKSFLSAQEMFDYLQVDNPIPVERSVDIILMDIMMPEMDGIEACRQLQKIPHLKDIPVIFVTALEDSDKVVEALDAGGTDYVMKPINKTELLARIRVALRLKYEKDWHLKQEEKIRNQLELSMKVQTSLLSEPINTSSLFMKASYLPAYKLAGDMYYWHKIDDDRYAVILLDMMGHGISASLVCMFISSVLRDSIRTCPDPEYVICELNRWMNSLNQRTENIPYYFTTIYMVIDTKNKSIEYINAGHPSGYALTEDNELIELSTCTCAVGMFERIDCQKSIITYKDKIQLILYTDGVQETLEHMDIDALNYIKQKSSDFWDIHTSCEPLDFILSKENQKAAEDDMCMVFIQATS